MFDYANKVLKSKCASKTKDTWNLHNQYVSTIHESIKRPLKMRIPDEKLKFKLKFKN